MKFGMFVLVVVSLVVSGVLLYPKSQSMIKSDTSEYSNFKRVYKPISFKLKKVFGFDFRVTDMKIFNDVLYVLNFSEKKIHGIDSVGNIIKTFGKQGRGPGEFLHYDSWYVENDTLIALDYYQLAIQKVTSKDSVVSYVKLDNQIIGSAYLGENKYMFYEPSKSSVDCDFVILDLNTGQRQTISVKKPAEEANGFSLFGSFVKNSGGNYFYVGQRSSYFSRIDQNGEFVYTRRTLDMSPIPKSFITPNGVSIDQSSPEINYYATVDKKQLCIVSMPKGKNDQSNWPTDVYDIETGKYLYSYNNPRYDGFGVFKFRYLSKNLMIATNEEKVLIYKVIHEK